MEGKNIINTFFFTAVNTGNSITINIPNKKPKIIKPQLTVANTGLTNIPVYIEFMGNKIYAYEIIGANQAPITLNYEFSNENYVNENHLLFLRNANTHAILNQGFITLILNFIY